MPRRGDTVYDDSISVKITKAQRAEFIAAVQRIGSTEPLVLRDLINSFVKAVTMGVALRVGHMAIVPTEGLNGSNSNPPSAPDAEKLKEIVDMLYAEVRARTGRGRKREGRDRD